MNGMNGTMNDAKAAIPDDAMTGGAVAGAMATGETVPGAIATDAPKKTALKKTGPKKTAPKKTAPKKTAAVRRTRIAARPSGSTEPDIATQAKQHTKAALEAFVAVMQDANAPAAARVAAATQILTWGYGRNAGSDGEAAARTVRLAWEG
jgi:hypothetical protein